jgi:predicted HAD superfamily hydrolase
MADDQVRGFAESLLAPIFAGYLVAVNEVAQSKSHAKLLFMAREGYYLKRYWDAAYGTAIPNEYFYGNRILINRAVNVHDDGLRGRILGSSYKNSIGQFLQARLGVTAERASLALQELNIEDKYIELPRDVLAMAKLLKSLMSQNELRSSFQDTKKHYSMYVENVLTDKDPIVCDLGFSGTFSKGLLEIVNKPITTVYFQHLIDPNDLVNHDKRLAFVSALAPTSSWNLNPQIAYMGIFLETILRAPEKMVIDIDQNLKPKFSKTEDVSSEHLKAIEQLHEHAIPVACELIKSGLHPHDLINLGVEAIDFLSVGSLQAPDSLKGVLKLHDDYSGFGAHSVI